MTAIEAALRRVRAGVRCPADADEVAALLEANGVTDEATAGWYGYPSVFVLAELVYVIDVGAAGPAGPG